MKASFARTSSGLALADMTVYGDVDRRPSSLTATVWRSVRVGAIAQFVEAQVVTPDVAVVVPDELLDIGSMHPGRAGRPDVFYAAWAAVFAEAVAGGSPSPVTDVMSRYGVTRGRVTQVVGRARARGMLTAGRQGRGQGRLTDKAVATLWAAGVQITSPLTGRSPGRRRRLLADNQTEVSTSPAGRLTTTGVESVGVPAGGDGRPRRR